METNSRIVLAAAVAALVAIGFAWRAASQMREANATLTEARRTHATQRDRVSAAARHLNATEQRRAGFEQTLANLRARPAAPSAAPTTKPVARAAPASRPNMFELFAAHPDFHGLYLKALAANLEARFGPLFRALALTPPQIEKFAAAMARQAESLSDVLTTARAQGLPESDPAIRVLRDQADTRLVEDLRGVLGEAGYGQYQDYRRTLVQREQVNEIVTYLYATEAPLTLAQANRLTEIFAQHDLQPKISREAFVPTNPAHFAAVLAEAGAVLKPAQMPTLEMMIKSYQAMQAIQQLAHQATRQNVATAAPPPK